MEEVLHAFGIDWRLIVIQIFNFTILMAALWYFLYTPILKVIDERKKKIETGIKDAEEAAKKKDEAEEEKRKTLSLADVEAKEVVARSVAYGKEKEAKLVSDAELKAEALIASAKKNAAELEERLRKESENDVAKAAMLAAEKILRGNN